MRPVRGIFYINSCLTERFMKRANHITDLFISQIYPKPRAPSLPLVAGWRLPWLLERSPFPKASDRNAILPPFSSSRSLRTTKTLHRDHGLCTSLLYFRELPSARRHCTKYFCVQLELTSCKTEESILTLLPGLDVYHA